MEIKINIPDSQFKELNNKGIDPHNFIYDCMDYGYKKFLADTETKRIIEYAKSLFDVDVDIDTKDRHRHLTDCRHAVSWYLREVRGMTLQSIGDIFKRNHASILNGVRKAKELIEYDPVFRSKIGRLDRKFNIHSKFCVRCNKETDNRFTKYGLAFPACPQCKSYVLSGFTLGMLNNNFEDFEKYYSVEVKEKLKNYKTEQ